MEVRRRGIKPRLMEDWRQASVSDAWSSTQAAVASHSRGHENYPGHRWDIAGTDSWRCKRIPNDDVVSATNSLISARGYP